MTHIELRDNLLNRVGWKQPTGSTYVIDTANTTTESGRYYQDEYAFVTIENIVSTMEKSNANDVELNAYLKTLAERAIILVISDVFKVDVIEDNILTNRATLFDNCISKRMAMVVGETILTSTRSNRTERLTKEFMQKLFFELNGNADSSSSRANPNFPTYVGLKSRYGACIKELKTDLGQIDALDIHTFRLPDYEIDEVTLL